MTGRQPYKRIDRVNDLVRKVVSETLIQKIHHHGLEEVIITDVRVSPDLKHARVFYRVLNEEHRSKMAKELSRVTGLVRRELAHQLRTRFTPMIRFEYDETFEYGNRIETLLQSIRKPNSISTEKHREDGEEE